MIFSTLCFFSFWLQHTFASLPVYFEEDRSIPMVEIVIFSNVGSAQDPALKKGLTNLSAELILRGTQLQNRASLNEKLDQLGSKFEVNVKPDYSVFRAKVLSKKLPEFLVILKEILTQPALSKAEFNKLKEEKISEALDLKGMDEELGKTLWNRFLFGDHPYAYPSLGIIKHLQSIKLEEAQSQAAFLLSANNLRIFGAGDMDSEFIESFAKELETSLDTLYPHQEVKPISEPIFSNKFRIRIVNKPNRTQTNVYIGKPGIHPTASDFSALALANEAFGGKTFTARMLKEIRTERGWSYSAFSKFAYGAKQQGWFMYYFPASKDTPEALAYGVGMIKNLATNGFSTAELEQAKAGLIQSSGFLFNTPSKRLENKIHEVAWNLPENFAKSQKDTLVRTSTGTAKLKFSEYLGQGPLNILVLGIASDLKPKIAKQLQIPEKEIEVISYNDD